MQEGSTGSEVKTLSRGMKDLRTCPVFKDLLASMGFSSPSLGIMQSIFIDGNFLAGSKGGRGLCRIANSILTTQCCNMCFSEIKWMEAVCPVCGSLTIPNDLVYSIGPFWSVPPISEQQNPPSTSSYLLMWVISSGLLI